MAVNQFEKCPCVPGRICGRCCVQVLHRGNAIGLQFCPVFDQWLKAHPPEGSGLGGESVVVPKLRMVEDERKG